MTLRDIEIDQISGELANPNEISSAQVIERWRDWRERVHALYSQIELALRDTSFHADRSGKHVMMEELPRRVGVPQSDLPPVDILRIFRPNNENAAILFPRGLWVIGVNGRIDLRITPSVGSTETYTLVDVSPPLSGLAKWVRTPIGAPFDREAFDVQWLLSKLTCEVFK